MFQSTQLSCFGRLTREGVQVSQVEKRSLWTAAMVVLVAACGVVKEM